MNLPGRPTERVAFGSAVVGFVVAAVLAWLGAGDYLADTGTAWSWHDRLYLAVQAFTLQLPAEPGPVPLPGTLQAARFLGPAVLGYAAARTLLLLFRDAWDEQVRVRWLALRGGTSIVCGLGAVGGTAMRALRPEPGEPGGRRRKTPMIAIEFERGSGAVGEARRRKVPVVFGSAADPVTWRRARVRRARQVLIACGDDQLNGEAAATILDEVRHGQGPVQVAVHLSRPELAMHQRERWRRTGAGPPFLEAFSTTERGLTEPVLPTDIQVDAVELQGATRLLAHRPPFPPGDPGTPRIVVVGTTELAEAVVVRSAQIWSTSGGLAGDRLDVVVAHPDATALATRLRRRFPDVDDVLALTIDDGGLDGETAAGRILDEAGESRVYVCLGEEADGLPVAVRLAEGLARRNPTTLQSNPVVVRTGLSSGLAELVVGADGNSRHHVTAVSPFLLACDEVSLFGNDRDRLARLAHEAYAGLRRAFPEPGRPSGDSFEPWADLSDDRRASTYAQVDGMRSHFARIGIAPAGVLPIRTLRVPTQANDAELWALAECEHERWMELMATRGVAWGPTRTKSTHPDMVPWAELDSGERRKDHSAVLAYLRALASLGQRLPVRGGQGELGQPGWEALVVPA